MDQPELANLMRKCGALVENTHVSLPSGAHTNGYFDQRNLITSRMYQEVIASSLVVRLLEFENRVGIKTKAIVGPLNEGGLWGSPVRSYLIRVDPRREFRSVLTRPSRGDQVFAVDLETAHQDGDYVKGNQVVIMNDVISTGASVGPILRAVQEAGGFPVVILSVCDRSVANADLGGLEVLSLVKVSWQIWDPSKCPLCPDPPFVPHIGGGN